MEESVGSTPSARLGAGSWEGDESPPADEDDFYKLMDEHGIIGLGEPEEEEPVWEPKDQPSPDTLALEDLSHRLRELMDSEPLSQSPKEDSRPLSIHDLEKAGNSDSVEEDTFSEEEEDRGGVVQWWQAESQPERDGQLEGVGVEPDRDVGVWSDLPLPREQEESEIRSRSVEGKGSRGGLCPVPSPSGGVRGGSGTPDSAVPPEQYPKAGQLNQRPMRSEADSWNWSGLVPPSNPMPDSGRAKPKQLPCELPCPAARHPPESSQAVPRLKACHHTARASTEPVGNPNLDGSRRGRLSHPLPDFSKVQPKVRFPKTDYRPPRSKGSSLCRTPGPGPPAALKSPADIVKEVLMSGSEGPHAAGSPSHPEAIMPPEFASAQQAHALMHQLQEDYNKLLTKYAEAENTIDRLRLKAKVNLYSDPPEPRHPLHLGTISMGSQAMKLTFPQAQRAELGHTAGPMHLSMLKSDGTDGALSSSEASLPSRSLDHPARQLLTESLMDQSDSFRMQVDCFEDFVKNGKLTPFQQMEGLSDLARGLDALERGYLQARGEHRVLQQHGRQPAAFDPDRELEGWIFRLGMRLEQLREQVGQPAPHQPHLRSSCPPPSEPDPLSAQDHRESPPLLPKTPIFPMEGRAMSPLSEEAEPQSAALHPKLWMKHQQAECDLSKLSDHYQLSKELPGLLDLCQESEVRGRALLHPSALGADPACRGNGRVANQESEQSIPSVQVKDTGGVQSGLPPAHTSRSLESHFPRPHPHPHPHPRGVDQPGGMATHDNKLQSGHGKASPLDGIVSPETDSGFVGSESSRLTRVVHSPPQRMSRARLSHHLEEAGTNVQPTPVQPSLASDSTRPSCPDHTGGCCHAPPSRGESRVPFPCPSKPDSPQHWDGSGITMTSGINESDIQSTPSVCEEEESQEVHTLQPTTEQLFGQRSPSPTATHHRVAPIRAQLTDKHGAMQSLRVEMNTLREGLEASLRQAPTLLPAWVAPPRPPIRFARSPKVRGGGEQVKQRTEEEDGWEEESLGPAFQRRSASCWRPNLSITPDSEHSERTSKPRSSRNIPASPAAQGVRGRARSDPVPCRGSGRLCHLTHSSGSDEPERRESKSCARPPSRSHLNGAIGGAVHSSRCPLCSAPEQLHGVRDARGAGSSRKRRSGSTPRGKRPVKVSHKASSTATPPPHSPSSVPVVYCVPVCPSVLYCPSPVLSAGPTYLRSLYRPLGVAKADAGDASLKRPRQQGTSLSSDVDPLGQSLSRAIEAATSMRAASQHMSRSLASGLRHQGALEQLCPH
uniref:AT-hook transcription factor n=1 Tax=Paramormyrops kingsleyae TaxID=1676925 RepID=A0A3B3SV74_9TELE|nr:AT-hook-containing transcription factor-like [Paramormyrops kingsleyae]XP_023687296.1 AT-hook-containing transcription factor-like [Paramormyrops kingsleyae]